MNKLTAFGIIILILVGLFFVGKNLGIIQTGVGDASRSVPFILSQTLTNNEVQSNTHLTWGEGFDFIQLEPTHPQDVLGNYADVDCYGAGCNDYDFNFKLNNENLKLDLGQSNQFHPLAKIKYNTIVIVNNALNEIDASETSGELVEVTIAQERYNEILLAEQGLDRYAGYDATEFALIEEFGVNVFRGRFDTEGKLITDTNTARQISKSNPANTNREFISSFDLQIEKGAIRVIGGDFRKLEDVAVGDKVKIPIILENRLWGGLKGRLVMVQTYNILATGGLQDTYSSETKDIIFGNNTFEIEVPVGFAGETEVKIYPVLDNVPQKLNAILLDDATKFDFETQEFTIIGESKEFLGTQDVVDSIGEGSYVTPSTEAKQNNKFSLKDTLFSHWTSIVAFIVALLILVYVGYATKWNWKPLLATFLILGGLIILGFYLGFIQTGIPSEVRILQEDGWILCDALLYEDVLGDNMVVTRDGMTGERDVRQVYTEEGDIYKFDKQGTGFYVVNDGAITLTRGSHEVHFDVKSCGGRNNISDFRYTTRTYSSFEGQTRDIITTYETHHNYAEGTTESTINGLPRPASQGISKLGSVRIDILPVSSTSGDSTATISTLMYKDLFNCKSDFNDALVFIDFSAGNIVDLQTIKNIGTPAVSFCPETPTQILNLVTGAQRNDFDIVSAIISRRSIIVPEGQLWRVQYYVNRERANIPLDCALYDMGKDECSASGLTGEIMEDGTPTIPSSSEEETTPSLPLTEQPSTLTQTTEAQAVEQPSTTQPTTPTPSPSGTSQLGVSDGGTEALQEGKVSVFVESHPFYAIIIALGGVILILLAILYGMKGRR